MMRGYEDLHRILLLRLLEIIRLNTMAEFVIMAHVVAGGGGSIEIRVIKFWEAINESCVTAVMNSSLHYPT